ncbi:MAG: WYL domain-containing protein [Alphaproteobacteria bacterium]|nr:WYL domain-containing protein [Alphaproteobacteria bacterium]
MSTKIRQEAIIRSLRRNISLTAAQLADELRVSKRTILRDIIALRDQGYVVYSETGPGGGLQLDPQSVHATARLLVSEVFALVISVASMRAAGVLPFGSLADSGLAKIEKSLPSDKIRDLRSILDCLFIGRLGPKVNISNMGEMDAQLLGCFERAFLKQLHLKFGYRDSKGNMSSRYVEPQAILILPPLWYLVAWDPSREAFRHFRMDRIIEPVVVEGAKFRRKHVPFDEHVSPVRDFSKQPNTQL